ncbi:MAG: hypothetical protein IPP74_14295 [Alphaproteobacteria bacterium]|nr:hypothetical protein [Alphaproteobacteria bacterium]
MREIRFRCWDKEHKCWNKEPTDRYQSSWICNMLDAGLTYDFGGPVFHKLRFELSQFTGLYDCDGKDIYEGDILISEDSIGTTYVYVVVWNHNGYSLDNIMSVELNGRKSFIFVSTVSGWTGVEFKIIGNKFEDPELLGE